MHQHFAAAYCVHFLGYKRFCPEDGGSVFRRNVCMDLPKYLALYLKQSWSRLLAQCEDLPGLCECDNVPWVSVKAAYKLPAAQSDHVS